MEDGEVRVTGGIMEGGEVRDKGEVRSEEGEGMELERSHGVGEVQERREVDEVWRKGESSDVIFLQET